MTKPKVTSATTLREYVESLLVTIILALFGTTFLVQAFKIPSSSMEKTLLVGDHLLVNKFLFAQPEPEGNWLPYREVRRGDIVVFKYPFPPHQHFVKRVIGLPGDRLKVVDQQVYINGEPLEEPYKIHERPRSGVQFGDTFPVTDGYVAHWMGVEWAEEVARLTENDELLIPTLLGREFPHGYSAAHIGVVVLDIQAALHAYEAVAEGKPLIERTVALCGMGFKETPHVKVRVGTPMEHILKGRTRDGTDLRIVLDSALTGPAMQDSSAAQLVRIPE